MRRSILLAIFLLGVLVFVGCTKEKEEIQTAKLRGKKVAMIIASRNFRDEELLKPKAILERNGAEVTITCSSLGEVLGMRGARVRPDMLIDELRVEDFDAIIFVGGTGASEYWDDSTAHQIARSAVEKGKVLGAICVAPVILAKAGVLKGREATVWASERKKLEAEGALYTGKNVEVDSNVVTADGPRSADEFGKAVVRVLSEK